MHHKETYGMHQEDAQRFEACRFDFRLDSKNGLTPSKRKRSDRRNPCYSTLFKCKTCGSLFDHRAALLEHKLVHNITKCPVCNLKMKSKAAIRQHLQEVHGFTGSGAAPLALPPARSARDDSVFDDPELGRDVTSSGYEETPFSPPASIAKHLQSLKPRLMNVEEPPSGPGAGVTNRKQAKPQKVTQQEEDEDANTAEQQQRSAQPKPSHPTQQSEPPMPMPMLQMPPGLQGIPGIPGAAGAPPSGSGSGPQGAPQGYICINVPIYIGHGQPPNGPPQQPQQQQQQQPSMVNSGQEYPHPELRGPFPPPAGLQPLNPTMMMHIPAGPGAPPPVPPGMPPVPPGMMHGLPPGMIRPPSWQPDSGVVIKEEPPSPDDDVTKQKAAFQVDDLEPGEIRPMRQPLHPGDQPPAKVMALGPNARFPPQNAGPFAGVPLLQAPPGGGMRLPVAADTNNGRRHSNAKPTNFDQEDILDLTKKSDDGEEENQRSSPSIPSGASTPKHKKPKSKFMLDNMVARLWQNKMSAPSSSSSGPAPKLAPVPAPVPASVAAPAPAQSARRNEPEVKPEVKRDHREARSRDPRDEQAEAPEKNSANRTTLSSRDARRKGKPMKGDISVNSDPLEAGISAEDREPGLQFTFINDSESGKMNLVGVSKPTPPRLANLMPAWTQIDAGLTPQNREYCTQKLKACKVCGQLLSQTELWEHVARVHGGETRPHRCSKCDFTGATRSEVLHHKYLRHGAGAASAETEAPPNSGPRDLGPPTGSRPQSSSGGNRAAGSRKEALVAPPPAVARRVTPPGVRFEEEEEEFVGKKEFMCSACGKGFSTAEGLETHIAQHETPGGESGDVTAPDDVTTHGDVTMTQQGAAPENADPMLLCEYEGCAAQFTNQQQLWKHIEKIHQKKWTRRQYSCPKDNCDRRFINPYHLNRHLAAHKDQPPHSAANGKGGQGQKQTRQSNVCAFPGCARIFKDKKSLEAHRVEHALKCDMCDYKCQQEKGLNWHMKTKHGVSYKTKDKGLSEKEAARAAAAVVARGSYASSDDVSENDAEIPPAGAVFPGMPRGSPVDLTTKTHRSVAEVKPVSPEDAAGNYGDEDDDDDDDDIFDLKKLKFASPHDMKSDVIQVQQIPAVNPGDPPFYSSVMKVNPRKSRKPTPSEHWSMEQAMGIKFHLCKVCRQMFQSSDRMWSHRLVFHDQIETTKCDKCSFSTDSQSELENHALLNHGKDSSSEHEYVCNLCGKEYTSRHGFKNHMLFRHNEGILMEYPCPHDGCALKLADRHALKAHYGDAHGDPGAYSQFCCPFDDCSGRFTSKALLQSHQIAFHDGETPAAVFKCEFANCEKAFRELKHLKVHAMLHTNEKPMRCGLCEYTCRQRNSMNWHMKTKHSMKKHVTPEGRTTYI